MPLHLHAHNQQMLEQVEDILTRHDRCCIEQATGCGKSFVVHAYLQNHPNMRTLIVTPHVYIASDQRRKIRADDPLYDFSGITTMTYAKLLYNCNEGILPTNLDCIVFDEMHHIGAVQWGYAASALIEQNPAAKIIGTTATPIRTDGRDMARALFTEDERTIPYTFVQALYDGVLPSPSYVVGTYELTERFQKIGNEIKRCANDELRQLLEAEYDVLRGRIADSAINIDDLIAEHLTALNPHPKVIVFCPSIEQMKKAVNKIPEWFREDATDMRIWSVCSENSATVNEERLRQFSEDDDDTATRVICSVDCIGEGIHVSNVDAIIMMRTTKSTNIYIQQMGRCLESGTKRTPVIFDLVDNLSSIGNPQFIKQEVRRTVRELCRTGEWSGRFDAMAADGVDESDIIDAIVTDTINNFGPTMSASQGDILNACAQQAQRDAQTYGRTNTTVVTDTNDENTHVTRSEPADDDVTADMDVDTAVASDDTQTSSKPVTTAPSPDTSQQTKPKRPYFDDKHLPGVQHPRPHGTTKPQDTVRPRRTKVHDEPTRLFRVIDRSVSIRELLDKLEDALAKNERANKAIVALCQDYVTKLANNEAVEPFDGWFEKAYQYCLTLGVDLKKDAA